MGNVLNCAIIIVTLDTQKQCTRNQELSPRSRLAGVVVLRPFYYLIFVYEEREF